MKAVIVKTAVGSTVEGRSPAALACAAVGICAVAVDLRLAGSSYSIRGLVGFLAFGLLFLLCHRDPTALGIRARPVQGYSFWVKLSVIALLGMGCVVAAVLLVVWSLGVPVPIYSTAPLEIPSRLISACVEAPLAEEIVYRGVICVASVPLLRPWGAILVSGALFALLHVIYGTPSPENAIGGFVLAWSYLHSGTILLPLAWHSLGNLVVPQRRSRCFREGHRSVPPATRGSDQTAVRHGVGRES